MIVVQLNGGLGNQMFQYAAGYEFAKAHKEELFIDRTFLEHYPFNDRITRRRYELDLFRVNEKPWISNNWAFKKVKNKYLYNTLFQLKLKKQGLKVTQESEVENSILSNAYLKGFFQNEKYFMNSRAEILKIFKPQAEISKANSELGKKIKGTNSISIHIRRGDYLLQHHKNHHGILSLDYYKSAIEKISSLFNSPEFFIFSDDLAWAEQNLKFPSQKAYFIGHNKAKESYMDIWLMSLCKGNIIANSSFSWWGAWLNDNNEKTVIGPKDWFAAKQGEIIPESWIKM